PARQAPDTSAGTDRPLDLHVAAIVDAVASFDDIETLFLEHALARSRGNLSAAARLLKLRRGQFEYRARKRQPAAARGSRQEP
ncbi:MAG: hypothetical protein JSS47_24870, partial [Proteobacteria bacterium]|nr:hypothetical protein [Pseudomonadota bacterium]